MTYNIMEACVSLQGAARTAAATAAARYTNGQMRAASYHQREADFFAFEARLLLTRIVGGCCCGRETCTYDPDFGCGGSR